MANQHQIIQQRIQDALNRRRELERTLPAINNNLANIALGQSPIQPVQATQPVSVHGNQALDEFISGMGSSITGQYVTSPFGRQAYEWSYADDPSGRMYRTTAFGSNLGHSTGDSGWQGWNIVPRTQDVSGVQRSIGLVRQGEDRWRGIFSAAGAGGSFAGEDATAMPYISEMAPAAVQAQAANIVYSADPLEGFRSSAGSSHRTPVGHGLIPAGDNSFYGIPAKRTDDLVNYQKTLKRIGNQFSQTVAMNVNTAPAWSDQPATNAMNRQSPVTLGYGRERMFSPQGGATFLLNEILPEGQGLMPQGMMQSVSNTVVWDVPLGEELNVQAGQIIMHRHHPELRQALGATGPIQRTFNLTAGSDLYERTSGSYAATQITGIETIDGRQRITAEQHLDPASMSLKNLMKANIGVSGADWVDTMTFNAPTDMLQFAQGVAMGAPAEIATQVLGRYGITPDESGNLNIRSAANAPGFMDFATALVSGQERGLMNYGVKNINTQMHALELAKYMGAGTEFIGQDITGMSPEAILATSKKLGGISINMGQGDPINISTGRENESILQNVSYVGNGMFDVNMQSNAIFADYFGMQFRPEQSRGLARISMEELSAMQRRGGASAAVAQELIGRYGDQVKPYIDYSLVAGATAGRFDISRARNIISEEQFQKSLPQLRQRIERAERLIGGGKELTEQQRVRAMEAGMSRTFGRDAFYQVGNAVLPSIDAGRKFSHYGRLRAGSDQDLMELNLLNRTISSIHTSRIGSMGAESTDVSRYQRLIGEYTEKPNYVRGMQEIEVPAVGGALLGSRMLAPNEGLLWAADIRNAAQSGMIDAGGRPIANMSDQEIAKLAAEDKLTGSAGMYPIVSDEMAGVQFRIRAQEEPGANWDVQSERGGAVFSPYLTSGFGKDFDGDPFYALMSAASLDAGPESIDSVINRALSSVAGETQSEVGAISGKVLPGWEAASGNSLEDAVAQRNVSKKAMGITYNRFLREMMGVTRNIDNLNPGAYKAAEKLAAFQYQKAIDLSLFDDPKTTQFFDSWKAKWNPIRNREIYSGSNDFGYMTEGNWKAQKNMIDTSKNVLSGFMGFAAGTGKFSTREVASLVGQSGMGREDMSSLEALVKRGMAGEDVTSDVLRLAGTGLEDPVRDWYTQGSSVLATTHRARTALNTIERYAADQLGFNKERTGGDQGWKNLLTRKNIEEYGETVYSDQAGFENFLGDALNLYDIESVTLPSRAMKGERTNLSGSSFLQGISRTMSGNPVAQALMGRFMTGVDFGGGAANEQSARMQIAKKAARINEKYERRNQIRRPVRADDIKNIALNANVSLDDLPGELASIVTRKQSLADIALGGVGGGGNIPPNVPTMAGASFDDDNPLDGAMPSEDPNPERTARYEQHMAGSQSGGGGSRFPQRRVSASELSRALKIVQDRLPAITGALEDLGVSLDDTTKSTEAAYQAYKQLEPAQRSAYDKLLGSVTAQEKLTTGAPEFGSSEAKQMQSQLSRTLQGSGYLRSKEVLGGFKDRFDLEGLMGAIAGGDGGDGDGILGRLLGGSGGMQKGFNWMMSSGMFWMNRMNYMWARPMQQNSQEYQNYVASNTANLMAAGVISPQDAQQGMMGDIIRRQVGMQDISLGLGRAFYNTWGDLMPAMSGGASGRGLLGLTSSVGAPMAFAGYMGSKFGVGLPAAALAGGVGLASYLQTAANDEYGTSLAAMNAFRGDIGDILGNTQGLLGNAVLSLGESAQGWQTGINALTSGSNIANAMAIGQQYGVNAAAQRSVDAYAIQAAARGLGGQSITSSIAYDLSSNPSQRAAYEEMLRTVDQQGLADLGVNELFKQNPMAALDVFLTDFAPNKTPFLNEEARGNLAGSLMYYYGDLGFQGQNDGRLYEQLGDLTFSGIDWESLTSMFASMRDINPSSVEAMQSVIEEVGSFSDREFGIRQLRKLETAASSVATVAQAALSAGDTEFANMVTDTDNILNYIGDMSPLEQQTWAASQQTKYNLERTSPLNMSSLTSYAFQGDLGQANIAMQYASQYAQMGSQYALRGQGGLQTLQSNLPGLLSMGTEQQNIAMALMGGDKMLWSELAAAGTAPQYAYTTQTGQFGGTRGMQAYYDVITERQANYLRSQDRYDMIQVSDKDMYLGTEGLQNQSTKLSLRQIEEQRKYQDRQRQIEWASTTGIGLGAYAGPQYEGMGSWYFEDQSRNLQRTQQDYSNNLTSQRLDLQGEAIGRSVTQFLEKWQKSYEQQSSQFQWEAEDMAMSRQKQLMQREWYQEDWSYQQSQQDLGYAWQMEDVAENLKYARGRQRRLLLRQQQRATIQYSMQSAQHERQYERQEELWALDDETYEKQLERYEQRKEWAEEELSMSARHFEQNTEYQTKLFELSKEQHTKEVGWLEQSRQLEDQQREIERAMFKEEYSFQTQYIEVLRGVEDKQKAIANTLTAISQISARNAATFAQTVESGSIFGQSMLKYINAANELLSDSVSNLSSATSSVSKTLATTSSTSISSLVSSLSSLISSTTKKYHDGGSVSGGDAWTKEVGAVLREGEYVVPENGALVLKGSNDNEMISVLVQIKEAIETMHRDGLNATVQISATQKSSNINAEEIYEQAWAV